MYRRQDGHDLEREVLVSRMMPRVLVEAQGIVASFLKGRRMEGGQCGAAQIGLCQL